MPEFVKLAKRSIAIKKMHDKLTHGSTTVIKTGSLYKRSEEKLMKSVFRGLSDQNW